MVVVLPNQFTRLTMYELLDQIIDDKLSPRGNKFIFDFSRLRFIEPVGVTVLSNLVEWLYKRKVEVFFRTPKRVVLPSSIQYLDDSLFFKRYLGKKYNDLARPRQTTIPLQLVSYQESYQWLDRRLLTWLMMRLSLSRASLINIKVCVEEIFNNIVDHAQENIGCVFAQHYPRNNFIQLAISDFGVGVPAVVKTKFPKLTDSEAIEKATTPGFSTKSNPRNTGAGLEVLLQNVVSINEGEVYIHSNHGILTCSRDDSGSIYMEKEETAGFYPGTLFEIILRTDTIKNIPDEEEAFEW